MRIPMLLGCLYLSSGLSQAAPLTPGEAGGPATPRPTARLIIDRDSNVPDACAVELHMEEQRPARLPAGESLKLKVPPGELNLRVKLAQAKQCAGSGLASSRSILIGPGETQHYRVMLGDEALFLAPQQDR